jgi:hypothetical protein
MEKGKPKVINKVQRGYRGKVGVTRRKKGDAQ